MGVRPPSKTVGIPTVIFCYGAKCGFLCLSKLEFEEKYKKEYTMFYTIFNMCIINAIIENQ